MTQMELKKFMTYLYGIPPSHKASNYPSVFI